MVEYVYRNGRVETVGGASGGGGGYSPSTIYTASTRSGGAGGGGGGYTPPTRPNYLGDIAVIDSYGPYILNTTPGEQCWQIGDPKLREACNRKEQRRIDEITPKEVPSGAYSGSGEWSHPMPKKPIYPSPQAMYRRNWYR